MAKWNDGRKDELRTMWLAGRSSSEIARVLGEGVTRNAVMGMANRLGLLRSVEHAANSSARPTGCCAPEWGSACRGVEAAPQGAFASFAPSIIAFDEDRSDVSGEVVPEVAVPAPPSTSPDVTRAAALPSHVECAVDAPERVDADADGAADADAVPVLPVVAGAADADAAAAEAAVAVVMPVDPRTPADLPVPQQQVGPPARVHGQAFNPAERLAMIRAAAQLPLRSRPRRPTSTSRMPPSPRDAAPPGEVSISSGVMARAAISGGNGAGWQKAFGLLEELTGVAYDERVPGHVPALVAIATVLAKGDPRVVLSPRLPEQSVLRVMRSFAEHGAVVAGKPPARWMEDVDDRAFYDEMLRIAA